MEVTQEQLEELRQQYITKYGIDVKRSVYLWNRVKLLMILGGPKCVKCGLEDIRVLQVDHIHGGNGQGNKDRERFNGVRDRTKGTLTYNRHKHVQYYLEHPDEARQELQVLCCNCHFIKTHHTNAPWSIERKDKAL